MIGLFEVVFKFAKIILKLVKVLYKLGFINGDTLSELENMFG